MQSKLAQQKRLLLQPFMLGSLQLSNRIVMAPLTRMRASHPSGVPNELMRDYYAQRASAGLIITEGTFVSDQARGWFGAPGIYTEAQRKGWQAITDEVHPAYVLLVSSVLGFTPMAMTAVYSATKAAIHSYAMSLRFKLRHTPVRDLEVIPPWVRTELLNSSEEPRAMPLDEFLQGTMEALATDANEILVHHARFLREQAGSTEAKFLTSFNEQLEGPQA